MSISDTYKLRAGQLVWIFGRANNYEAPDGLYLSPRGDRATMSTNSTTAGVPVFDPGTADTVYHVKQLTEAPGVAFSPRGDTLYLAGRHGPILALDPRDGRELARSQLAGDVNVSGIVLHGPWLLVSATYSAGGYRLRVIVLDRRTLRIAGTLEPPLGHEPTEPFWNSTAAGSDGLFIVSRDRVFSFGLLQ